MFLYFSKNAKINNLVDIFISSTSVIFGIFQAVVITGYTLLGPFWFEPVTCEICPKLIIYFGLWVLAHQRILAHPNFQ